VNATAFAVGDFRHCILLPHGAAAAAPALIYQSGSSQGAIRRWRFLHDSDRRGSHNPAVTTGPAELRESWLTRRPIAHRGLHDARDARPENSLAAFDRACALGFPAELDARLTRDREVVVFHDRALRRLTGAAGRVEDRRAADIRALRLLGTTERVPTLREVLDLVGGRVPLLVELKSSVLWPALERAALAALDGYAGDVAIQSFKRRTVRAIGNAMSLSGGEATATLVSVFTIRPTFDATVDAAGDLPGPGAVALPGTAFLCNNAMCN